MTPAQFRAGRHLACLSQMDIARATGLSIQTVQRAENERDVSISKDAIAAVRRAREKAGVIFLEENGEGPAWRKQKAKR